MSVPPLFCTLFNKVYLTRGLAMIESLVAHCPAAQVAVIAFDAETERGVRGLGLSQVEVISLAAFETPALRAVKPTRSVAEYFWTCTTSAILHCLDRLHWPACTYVDADCYFFSNPQALLDEMGDASILLTEHRYTPRYDLSAESGRYCVQFQTFRNDEAGRRALLWWRDRCLERCSAVPDDGHFGDQYYLEDWTTRFEGVHLLQHPGGGVAPWNVQRYALMRQNGRVLLAAAGQARFCPLVFYHFHALRYLPSGQISLAAGYELSRNAVDFIYRPHVAHLAALRERLERQGILGPAAAAPALTAAVDAARDWLRGARRTVVREADLISAAPRPAGSWLRRALTG
jgi:hypothetical protein